MRKNHLLLIFFLLVLVGAGLVWSAKKINQKTPPDNNPPIVGNGGIDTSDWKEFSSKRVGYSMLIPTGFQDVDVLYDLPFESKDNVVRVENGEKKIYTRLGYYKEYPEYLEYGDDINLPKLLLSQASRQDYDIYEIEGREFLHHFNNGEDIYATANNEFVVNIAFTNIEKGIIELILKNFNIKTTTN